MEAFTYKEGSGDNSFSALIRKIPEIISHLTKLAVVKPKELDDKPPVNFNLLADMVNSVSSTVARRNRFINIATILIVFNNNSISRRRSLPQAV